MQDILKKRKYKKLIILLLCVLMLSNIAHMKVLCFGVDGHIELESAFNSCCEDHDEHGSFYAAAQGIFSFQAEGEESKRCGLCIDIPITIDIITLSNTDQKWDPIVQISGTNLHIDTEKLNSSVYEKTLYNFNTISYYEPLRTVIMLV